jgi:hypothetical protein
METIKYSRDLPIVNIQQLKGGTGAKYLLAWKSNDPAKKYPDNTIYVAHSWKRKLPIGIPPHYVLIEF